MRSDPFRILDIYIAAMILLTTSMAAALIYAASIHRVILMEILFIIARIAKELLKDL